MQNKILNKYNYEYDSLFRFISYFYQIDLVNELKPKTILEIGIGNATVSNYLKQSFVIKTCDINSSTKPDYIRDVRNLGSLPDNAFDLVMACEILEHIPFNDVGGALKELHRVTNKNVIISVPYTSMYFEFIIKFTGLSHFFKKDFLHLIFRIPFLKPKYSSEHCWELGRISIKKLRKILLENFMIIKEVKPILVRHHFFILEKR